MASSHSPSPGMLYVRSVLAGLAAFCHSPVLRKLSLPRHRRRVEPSGARRPANRRAQKNPNLIGGVTMAGPYVISDLSLLTTLPGKDAVVPASDQGYGVQCVGLVKYYSSCGATAVWKEGDLVGESPGLARGTAIATFDDTGKYRSAASGNNRKSTRLNSSHGYISYAVFCLNKQTCSMCMT